MIPPATDADLQRTVKEWAGHRSQLYNVFTSHVIDVLWDADRPLIDVCREKHLNPRHVADELAAASKPGYRETGTNWHQASIGELCEHVQSTHHDYLRRELPRLAALVDEIDDQAENQNAELIELSEIFDRFRWQLLEHIETEEGSLFPALRSAESGEKAVQNDALNPRELTRNMRDDHDRISASLLRRLNGWVRRLAGSRRRAGTKVVGRKKRCGL